MAYEVKPWKQSDCSVSVKIGCLSQRETFSREINEAFGEGGGLNANYRTVDAIAVTVDALRGNGFFYGLDYVFKTAGIDQISFDFKNQDCKKVATKIFANFEKARVAAK